MHVGLLGKHFTCWHTRMLPRQCFPAITNMYSATLHWSSGCSQLSIIKTAVNVLLIMRSTCPTFAISRGQSITMLALSLAILVHVTDAQRTKSTCWAGHKCNTHSRKSVNLKVPLQRPISTFDASKMSQAVRHETSHCDSVILFILKLFNDANLYHK